MLNVRDDLSEQSQQLLKMLIQNYAPQFNVDEMGYPCSKYNAGLIDLKGVNGIMFS